MNYPVFKLNLRKNNLNKVLRIRKREIVFHILDT